MHTVNVNDYWEVDFIRDDSDFKPDGVTPEDLAGCCDIHYRRDDRFHSAEIEVSERVHNLELIVTASVYSLGLENPEESMELESEYAVKRKFKGANCKAKASTYAQELRIKINQRYFSHNENQLELPLIF